MAITEPDAIIIGGGHNSLACASHLAVKGLESTSFRKS